MGWVLALLLPLAAVVPPATGGGLLLPVVDAAGDPPTAALVEATLAADLAVGGDLASAPDLRGALRRLRIRDLGSAPPEVLDRLAGELGADWFFTATLHEASAGPVPRVTLSARLYRVGEVEVAWAGFEAGSGLDDRGWLGRGAVDRVEVLAESLAHRLAASWRDEGQPELPRGRSTRRSGGFLAPSWSPGDIGRVAVIPFGSLAKQSASRASDLVTDCLVAELRRAGVRVLVSGLVNQIQRQRGRLERGELDEPTRLALAAAGANQILTGDVEVFDAHGGEQTQPRVALGARLLDAASGRILWMAGEDRRGFDGEGLFQRGRIYSAGVLTQEEIRSLLSGFLTIGRDRSGG